MTDGLNEDFIVASFVDALSGCANPKALLADWAARYPDLQVDFAAIVVDFELEEQTVDLSVVAEQATLTREIMEQLTKSAPVGAGGSEKREAPTPLPSLELAAQAHEIGFPGDLAQRLRLPVSLVDRLNRGGIEASSIPMILIDQLAALLETSREQIAALWMPASSPELLAVRERGASYSVFPDFAQALAASDATPDDRQYWNTALRASRTLGEHNAEH